MERGLKSDIYGELGVKRVINAYAPATALGGSVLPPTIRAAMEEANRTFVSMHELLEKTGQSIAKLLRAEAAFVTPGCFAALALSAAGTMTGKDPERIERLPDTSGMKNVFLIQKPMRYRYDRFVTVPGGELIEVGDELRTTAIQLEAAIDSRTAGIVYPAHLEGTDGTLPLDEVIPIAQNAGVAVLVDAAFQVYPLERMRGLASGGADLVCFSTKYMGGPNSAGFLCGQKAAVEAAALNGFIAYEMEENNCFGRGYKIDRQEVIATVVTLREWFAMDHQGRLIRAEQRIQVIANALSDLPHVKTEQVWLQWGAKGLAVTLDEEAMGKTAAGIEQDLREGDPSIWVDVEENILRVGVETLDQGEEQLVARRLREVLQT